MDWYTKERELTEDWDEAHFILEAGEFVRIVKPGGNTIYNIVYNLKKMES